MRWVRLAGVLLVASLAAPACVTRWERAPGVQILPEIDPDPHVGPVESATYPTKAAGDRRASGVHVRIRLPGDGGFAEDAVPDDLLRFPQRQVALRLQLHGGGDTTSSGMSERSKRSCGASGWRTRRDRPRGSTPKAASYKFYWLKEFPISDWSLRPSCDQLV